MAEQLTRQYSDQLPGARPIFRCHYEVLGVSVDAKGSEITAAYRRAQLKWHPDKNPDNQMEASARCKEIVRAYNVLSDCKGAKPGYKKWYDANKDRLLKHQGRLEILYEFGRIATDPDEATKYFSEAIELCRNGDPEDLAKLYAGRAWAKFRRSIQNANNSGDWQKDMKKAFSTSPHSHHVLLFSARICNLKKNFRIAQDECMEGLTNYTFISSLQQEDDIIKDFEEQLNIALDGQGHQIDEPLRTYWQACVREIRKQKEQREVQKQKKQIIWGFVSVVALNILCIALLYLAICEGWVRLRYLEQMARRLRKPPTKHLAAASLFGAPSKTLHEFKVDFDDSQRFKTLKAGSSKKVTTFPTIIGLEPGNQVSKAYEETNVTAEALEKWVTGMVRHHVLTVTSTNCDERGGIFDPKTDPEYVALLFHKHHIPPLVWSGLSITYMGVLRIGQVRQSEKVLVNRFNVVEFPSVVVIKRPASSRGQWIVKLFDLPPLPSAPRCREEENGRCSTPEAEERQRAAELLLQEYGKLKAFLDGFARKNKDAREYRKDYEKFMKDMKPSQED